jgi:hypothetical protein
MPSLRKKPFPTATVTGNQVMLTAEYENVTLRASAPLAGFG